MQMALATPFAVSAPQPTRQGSKAPDLSAIVNAYTGRTRLTRPAWSVPSVLTVQAVSCSARPLLIDRQCSFLVTWFKVERVCSRTACIPVRLTLDIQNPMHGQ